MQQSVQTDATCNIQQCWELWVNNVASVCTQPKAHAHYARFTKTYGLHPSHDTLQAPTLLGVVASVSTPLTTCTQQLPTLLAQQCWELSLPFARSLKQLTFLHVHRTFLCISNSLPSLCTTLSESA